MRLITDPTFDPPGTYPVGDRVLTKTTGPALKSSQIGKVDAVLLSHDQHPDNLDRLGREWLASVPMVITTPTAADRLNGGIGLLPWTAVDLPTPDGRVLHVTALPAQHGPDHSEHLTGPVTGFLLSGDRLPTIYISGDNASLAVVESIAARVPEVDVAILFVGAARTALLGSANLTLDGQGAARAAGILKARAIVPAHFEGWGHFTEGASELRRAFSEAGLGDRLHLLHPGEARTI